MLGRREKRGYRRVLNFLSLPDYTTDSPARHEESSPGDSEAHYDFI